MLKYFNCPDGITRPIAECLEYCPRKEGRCLSLPTLHEIGRDRPWRGTPSTTQLLNPTRLEYLKITEDYAIDPFDHAFAVLGTRHHQRLEAVAKRIEGLIAEKNLKETDIQRHSGILDLLEPDELQDGFFKLVDYKTWGSYAVAKMLGRKYDRNDYDRHQTELQLNDYRIKAEALGFPVSRMMIQATVRDGGTFIAQKNGIMEKLTLIPIDRLDDNEVIAYFAQKEQALLTALEKGELPPICDFDSRWANRRCKAGFCPVVAWCPKRL